MSADRRDDPGRIQPRSGLAGKFRGLLNRTTTAIRGALGRRDGLTVFLGITGLYLLTYLWGLRQLTVSGRGGLDLFLVEAPLATMVSQQSMFVFQPVARVVAGPLLVLLSPVNVLLGLVLGVLVGSNLAVSLVAWRGPSACRLGAGAGITAGVPGLLSGFACCGPQILVVTGLQASAGVIAAAQWLVPVAVILLIGTLLWVGNQVPLRPS